MHAKKSHILDGISLVKFFYWLDKQNISKDLCEMKLSKKLEDFRKLHKSFFPSFPTISAIGANGSIIHYNPRNNPKNFYQINFIYAIRVVNIWVLQQM